MTEKTDLQRAYAESHEQHLKIRRLEQELAELRPDAAVVRKVREVSGIYDFSAPTYGVVNPIRIYPSGTKLGHSYFEVLPGFQSQIRVRGSRGGLYVTAADDREFEIGMR